MPPSRQGYSLVEVLMTLIIVGILVAIAYPSYRSFIQNTRVTTLTNDFMSSLAYARAEALKGDVAVTICPTADDNYYDCGPAANWPRGWIIFQDRNQNGHVANLKDRLKVYRSGVGDIQVMTTVPYITYNRAGFLSAGIGAFTLSLTDCVGNSARLVNLSPTGRATLTSALCN